jgi:hypothetical protein
VYSLICELYKNIDNLSNINDEFSDFKYNNVLILNVINYMI